MRPDETVISGDDTIISADAGAICHPTKFRRPKILEDLEGYSSVG